ncbi:hypothetical protein HDV05_005782 [Chytridiales sp. JEL 0842]|nr:hypothetical protein HDV05_005782 [Chytridiales sp. JEL 0842]
MSSRGSPTRSQKAGVVICSKDGGSIDVSDCLPRAHDWTGVIIASGRHFKDEHGRVLLLRGVNVAGHSKAPTLPTDAHYGTKSFYDDKNMSFVGRPFYLDEIDEHLRRLRGWGLTLLRVLVTWEALEHKGPGLYDEEYIDYLIKFLEKAHHYGIRCFLDPHQDTWSRFSGGSGAPGWTFAAAGLDIKAFAASGAAHLHDLALDSTNMLWPTNYTKLACATMFTLFWGGDVFAPNAKATTGENLKDYLQRHYIACYVHLAERVQHCKSVIGFEAMNEPHPGYIGLQSLNHFDQYKDLHFGPSPSALQSFALGTGVPLDIDIYKKSWPFPTVKSGTTTVNPKKVSAWLPGKECIWRTHGLWEMDSNGKPKALKLDYFTKHPITGQHLNFDQDFYLPFIKKYIDGIHSVNPNLLVFFEPVPNCDPPVFSDEDKMNKNVVFAPHWYDLDTVFKKYFDGRVTHDVQGLSRGMNVLAATYFGIKGAIQNYSGQVRNIVNIGTKKVGERPILIGECGIPMDINEKKAFETGDFTHHTNFLNACINAMECNMVNFTLWNYNPSNTNTHGDHWNGEDFSIYSPQPSRPESRTTSRGTSRSASRTPSTTNLAEMSEQQRMKSESPPKFKREPSKLVSDITTSLIKQGSDSSIGSTGSLPTSPFEITNLYFEEEELEGHPDHEHHTGGRVLDAVIRPYAAKVAGTPTYSFFNIENTTFSFEFVTKKLTVPGTGGIALISEFFIPSFHYKRDEGINIEVSDGEWKYLEERQTLYWRYDPTYINPPSKGWFGTQTRSSSEKVKHWIKISPKESTAQPHETLIRPTILKSIITFGLNALKWVAKLLPANKTITEK